ncbi:hypothetical protein H0H81_007310 [Sphagnurus paluster]|uniref:Fatty acid desaturase domain-containing protein n=1 Tax=Sphagnurus paluster TaxID=117069 RepID=A0A9P7G1H2_9AGAR|nr:hypothetical protein H0H81_007310 [Sphagnurus paluster]
MFSIFEDGPEYKQRLKTPFTPPKTTLSEVHSIIPKHLHEKNTGKASLYVARDVFCAVAVYKLGWLIDPATQSLIQDYGLSSTIGVLTKWGLWALYWHWQGVILAGWWCMAHEAGHGTLSKYSWFNHIIGYSLHTFILVPYYAWRSTHHAHHKATMSVERDENFVPRTRTEYNLPAESTAQTSDYHEIFEETPIYTLVRMLLMQAIGWQYYLCTNAMGNPMYPPGTNHFQPSSPLFKPHERKGIVASNIGLAVMSSVLYLWTQKVGLHYFIKLYFVPYIVSGHSLALYVWLMSLCMAVGKSLDRDAHIPSPFRPNNRTLPQQTVDIPERRRRNCRSPPSRVGWALLLAQRLARPRRASPVLFNSILAANLTVNVDNQPEVTKILKQVLKDDYNYDSTNTFRALYRTFTQCCFIEDDGEIVFYKNKHGKAARVLAEDALKTEPKKVI